MWASGSEDWVSSPPAPLVNRLEIQVDRRGESYWVARRKEQCFDRFALPLGQAHAARGFQPEQFPFEFDWAILCVARGAVQFAGKIEQVGPGLHEHTGPMARLDRGDDPFVFLGQWIVLRFLVRFAEYPELVKRALGLGFLELLGRGLRLGGGGRGRTPAAGRACRKQQSNEQLSELALRAERCSATQGRVGLPRVRQRVRNREAAVATELQGDELPRTRRPLSRYIGAGDRRFGPA